MRTPLPINLDALLRQRAIEGERVEYKAGWNPERALHTICAFANDFHNLGGGYLVIGVEEANGRPVLPPKGIDAESVESMQKEPLHLGYQAIQPPFHALSASYTVDGRTVFVVWAPGGETRPYKCRVSLAKDAKEWAYYIRHGSSTVLARGADERELLSLAATVPFDDRVNASAAIEDLSRRLIGEFLDEVRSELASEAPSLPMEALGRQMNVVGGPSEAPFPKNVGLLFFNDEPHRFFPATQIDVVYFPESDEDRTYFLIRLPVHERAEPGAPHVPPHVTPHVTPHVERLLAAMQGEHRRDELQERLGLTDRKHLRTRFLAPAMAAGLLEMTDPGSPRSRQQRYRLTDLGRKLQAELASRDEDSPGESGN